jgi:uncharacterized protein (DUF305 family)
MRAVLSSLVLVALLTPGAQAQVDLHQHHHQPLLAPAGAPAAGTAPAAAEGAVPAAPIDPSAHLHSHSHDLGPAGSTYDLRWIDAMAVHHTGALRMGEFVFDIGSPGVGSLAKEIWRDQAQEIKAMGQWRKAWYPEAPMAPVALRAGGDPDAIADLIRMGPAQIQAMQMINTPPTAATRVTWFLEGMLHHHGGALLMAHDALAKSSNPTIRRLARTIIVAQRQEIIRLRRMLQHDGLNKPAYHQYDSLFVLK